MDDREKQGLWLCDRYFIDQMINQKNNKEIRKMKIILVAALCSTGTGTQYDQNVQVYCEIILEIAKNY